MGGAPKKAEVQNIVASTRLADRLDLDAVVPILEGAQYDTERFPGLVYRMKKPKTALLLFRTGKMVCTGGKSLDDVRESVEIVAGKLHEAGMPVERHPEITVQNMVAVCDLGSELNLNTIAISLDMNLEYEPEQFPGLVLRLEDPKIVCLLFGSGKMVLTGARNTEDLDRATESVREILSRSGLL